MAGSKGKVEFPLSRDISHIPPMLKSGTSLNFGRSPAASMSQIERILDKCSECVSTAFDIPELKGEASDREAASLAPMDDGVASEPSVYSP